jgi:hypothetical protein
MYFDDRIDKYFISLPPLPQKMEVGTDSGRGIFLPVLIFCDTMAL